jgi:hypothetical protein
VSLWDVLVSIFWFMLLFAWIWLLVSLLGDIFRDPTMSGWGKAAWTLFIIVVPWLGALMYIIVRGSSMHERDREQARRRADAYRRDASWDSGPARSSGPSDELQSLADLRDRGVLSAEEFAQAKARVLGNESAVATTSGTNTHERVEQKA